MKQEVKEFFEKETQTFSYVIADPAAGKAAVIDPVLTFHAESGRTDTAQAEAILGYLSAQNLQLEWILETHAHADHLSGAEFLQAQTGARVGIGRGIVKVQSHFKKLFMLDDLKADGSQFDRLLEDGDIIPVGDVQIKVMATPGHTGDSLSYVAGEAAFIGDTLFTPELGTARCDFPGGDAATLYRSIHKILSLPESTRLHLCHDYPDSGRTPRFATSIAEQKQDNIHVGGGRSEAEFVTLRKERDKTLAAPRLILPAIQVNIRAGRLPDPDKNGIRYLRIPLNQI